VVINGVNQGAVPMMVASLPRKEGLEPPIFLTVEEYDEVVRFIEEAPAFGLPQMLLPVGTIKSGKSTLVARVIDRLVMGLRLKDAREGGAGISSRRPPVFLKFKFKQRCTAEAAAQAFIDDLQRFARGHGVTVVPQSKTALNALAGIAGDVAEAISKTGHELWLLIDEAQGPVVGSNLATSDDFVGTFKQVSAVRLAAVLARAP